MINILEVIETNEMIKHSRIAIDKIINNDIMSCHHNFQIGFFTKCNVYRGCNNINAT